MLALTSKAYRLRASSKGCVFIYTLLAEFTGIDAIPEGTRAVPVPHKLLTKIRFIVVFSVLTPRKPVVVVFFRASCHQYENYPLPHP